MTKTNKSNAIANTVSPSPEIWEKFNHKQSGIFDNALFDVDMDFKQQVSLADILAPAIYCFKSVFKKHKKKTDKMRIITHRPSNAVNLSPKSRK